jgi:hypothetical protein
VRRQLCIAALALAAASIHPTQAASPHWDGTWSYEFNAGRNAADTGMVVAYRLDLAPGTCRLHAEGYQTDETIRCAATAAGTTLRISFTSYDDGKTTNKYGVALYKPGAALFTLTRQGAKVLTTFAAYTLPDDKPHPPGVYFHR